MLNEHHASKYRKDVIGEVGCSVKLNIAPFSRRRDTPLFLSLVSD